jgi:hypothetical protein
LHLWAQLRSRSWLHLWLRYTLLGRLRQAAVQDVLAIAAYNDWCRWLRVTDCASWRRWRPLIIILVFIIVCIHHVAVDLAAGGLRQPRPSRDRASSISLLVHACTVPSLCLVHKNGCAPFGGVTLQQGQYPLIPQDRHNFSPDIPAGVKL